VLLFRDRNEMNGTLTLLNNFMYVHMFRFWVIATYEPFYTAEDSRLMEFKDGAAVRVVAFSMWV
jgi:hypothetical protein